MKNVSLIKLKFSLEKNFTNYKAIENTIHLLDIADSYNKTLVGISDYNDKFTFLEEFSRLHPTVCRCSLFIEDYAKEVIKKFNIKYPDKYDSYYRLNYNCKHHYRINDYKFIIGIYEKIDNEWIKIR